MTTSDTPLTDAYLEQRKAGEDEIGWRAFAKLLERRFATSEAKLREAREWMQHKNPDCAKYGEHEDDWNDGRPCTCGLDAFLAGERKP